MKVSPKAAKIVGIVLAAVMALDVAFGFGLTDPVRDAVCGADK